MHRLIAIWSKPEDVDGFEEHYQETHMKLVGGLPGLRAASSAKVTNSEHYRVASLDFDSMEDLGSAMGSDTGKAVSQDSDLLQKQFGASLTVLFAEVDHSI